MGLAIIAQAGYSQFVPGAPHSLNDDAWLTGSFGIGTDAMPRKLNIYKSVTGVPVVGAPIESYTTGLRITHNYRLLSSQPYVEYKWDLGTTNNRMDLTFMNTNTRIMTWKSDGKVGIATAAPDATLHIKDFNGVKLDAHIEGFTLLDGNEASLLLGRQTGAPYGEWGIEYNNWSKGLNFWKPSGSNNFGNYFLFIADNGNVSIGTDDAQGYKLAVKGDMIAERVVVKLHADWPDFVFAEKYGLMELEEVADFIEANHHLPNIPSAQEVEQGGIDLGQMDAALLQKIEELTLYVIQLKEENKKQQEVIDELLKK